MYAFFFFGGGGGVARVHKLGLVDLQNAGREWVLRVCGLRTLMLAKVQGALALSRLSKLQKFRFQDIFRAFCRQAVLLCNLHL